MKNLIYIFISISLFVILLSSCEQGLGDFLDKAPGVDVTEDTIFSSKTQVETFIANMYNYGLHRGYAIQDKDWTASTDGLEAGATDEGESTASWFWSNRIWNNGNLLPTNDGDVRFGERWLAIRMLHTLLERIDEVPDADQTYKSQVKGEALFIRAMNYWEMFKYYGGVPIVDHRFKLDEDMKLPRNTVEEVVNFIVKDCDDAAGLLPSSYPSDLRGRATKGAALMLKSRTLLYAASPQFNTGSPYLDFGANNTLICYGNPDDNRWQLAADAARAVIDWAPSGGIHLITDKGTDKNYKYVWEKQDNAEIILAEKGFGAVNYQPFWYILPPVPPLGGLNGTTAPLNFVKLYEKKDGTKQTWDPSGGNNLMQKYAELDPRFKQTMGYNGSYWNADLPVMQIYVGGDQYNQCRGGVWVHKLIPEALTRSNPFVVVNWTIFRLAEAYLNYAEALNEAQGPIGEAYNAVNLIRQRSGMPDLPPGLTKDQFRERVRNERAIELAYEEHRLWDVRRWLIAENEGIMNGDMWGIKIFRIENSAEFRYEPYVFEKRTFLRRMYLNPFPQNEVYKGYLIQNPGY